MKGGERGESLQIIAAGGLVVQAKDYSHRYGLPDCADRIHGSAHLIIDAKIVAI
jgi:hypothetical protein